MRDGVVDRTNIASYENADVPHLIAQIQRYQSGRFDALEGMVIALAAPAEGDRVALTNLDWVLDKRELMDAFSVRSVTFLNDFTALGYALGDMASLDTLPLAERDLDTSQTRLILGAGTGFNCAAYLTDGSVTICEAGHASFVPITDFDLRLREKMTERYGRCSNERLLSGQGFREIYADLSNTPVDEVSGPDVLRAGVDGRDATARQACMEFARMLGQTAGDLALTFWAKGGVWLAGGPCRALAPILALPDGPFLTAFRQKGRMTDEMAQVPVALLQDDYAALHGCAHKFRH